MSQSPSASRRCRRPAGSPRARASSSCLPITRRPSSWASVAPNFFGSSLSFHRDIPARQLRHSRRAARSRRRSSPAAAAPPARTPACCRSSQAPDRSPPTGSVDCSIKPYNRAPSRYPSATSATVPQNVLRHRTTQLPPSHLGHRFRHSKRWLHSWSRVLCSRRRRYEGPHTEVLMVDHHQDRQPVDERLA
jgi:hypothetical protein